MTTPRPPIPVDRYHFELLARRVSSLEELVARPEGKTMQHKKCAQDMLDAVDAFMGGKELTEEQRELEKAATTAGAYAAAAYDAHIPKSGGECHALTRAFLLALIDPAHADLDYLRPDPATGVAAREAAAQLTKITKSR